MAAGQGDYLDGVLGLGLGLGPGTALASAYQERARLHTQRAAVARLIDEVSRGRSMVPPDAGRFWQSDAQRAYSARLQQLRGQLALAQLSLDDARDSIDRALERVALAVTEAQAAAPSAAQVGRDG
ncbi:hypothetical protein [Leifsonia sp. Root112D2]|uniref:hypothetical protein n=1 Tax=Leifsonia sp. Root112D2 TaxID=1736426 RepID=UPI0006FEFBB8|nr:hypothetical protein [Leifsonia sp. Root112D2]